MPRPVSLPDHKPDGAQRSSYADPGPPAGFAALNVDVLSDTQGIDFGPYLKQVLSQVQSAWRVSTAAHGSSEVVIRGTFNQAGGVSGMVLVKSSQDTAADQAAWRSITAAGQFPSLPAGFNGPGLTVNLHFSRPAK